MKILWIGPILPTISIDLGKTPGFAGGWTTILSEQISAEYQLGVIFSVSARENRVSNNLGNLSYWGIPACEDALQVSEAEIQEYETILRAFQPDIIHIWGTETMHSYHAFLACERLGLERRVVISITGLVSLIARHFWAFIDPRRFETPSLKERLLHNSLVGQQKQFAAVGQYEETLLQKAHYVIGRTDWDRACLYRLNPTATYFHCDETLRHAFYGKTWDYERCEKYSIFIGQYTHPIKGFHLMLEALQELVRDYPQVQLYTTGPDKFTDSSKPRWKDSCYERYIRELLEKYQLMDRVHFLGGLNEDEMCERMLKSHVFASASSIENSPNTLGEAMLLGVPCVSSDVGGVKTMLVHEQEGLLYQADAPYMLAHSIHRIFNDRSLAEKFSQNARAHASVTHDQEKNLRAVLDAYHTILQRMEYGR